MFSRFEILRPMEGGPDVRVYLVSDRWNRSGRYVLTLLPPAEGEASYDEEAFEQIIALRRSLEHPCLNRVTGLAYRGRRLGLVSDFLASAESSVAEGRVDPRQVALQLAEVVGYLHRRKLFLGVLKPSQIFIDSHGALRLNFLLPSGFWGQNRNEVNSLRYAAPEWIESGLPCHKSDLYSLGLNLYRIFTGEMPFVEQDHGNLRQKQILTSPARPRKLNPDIPPVVEDLILDLIHKDPELRPDSTDYIRMVLGRREQATTAPQRFKAPLIGRWREKDLFRQKCHQVRSDSRSNVLVIEGPSGIGKSRLLRHLEMIGTLQKFPSFSITHHSADQPLQPFLRLLEQLRGDCKEVSAGQLFETLLCALSEASRGAPLLLFVDDLHWMDECARDIYKHLLYQDDLSLLLVVTLGSGYTNLDWIELREELRGRNMLSESVLDALDDEDCHSLIACLLEQQYSSEIFDRLNQHCAGSPFFIYEFLRSWKEGGQIRLKSGHWEWQTAGSDTSMPSSVATSIESRLSQLDQESVEALECVSLLKRPVSLSLLAEIMSVPIGELSALTTQLEGLGFVLLQGGLRETTVCLEQEWTGQVIRDRLDPGRRRELHQRIAESLETKLDEKLQPFLAESLLYHFLAAERVSRAEAFLAPALSALEKERLYRRASSAFFAALDGGAVRLSHWPSLQKAVELLYLSGQLDRCLRFAEKYTRPGVLPSGPQQAWLLSFVTTVYLVKGQNGRAIDSAEQALEHLAQEEDPSLYAQLQAQRLSGLSLSGQRKKARQAAQVVIELLHNRDASNPRLHHALGIFYRTVEGTLQPAIKSVARSVEISQLQGRHIVAAGRLLNLAVFYSDRCQTGKVTRITEYVLNLARETGNLELENFAHSIGCIAARKRGRHAEAVRSLNRLIALNANLNRNRHLAAELRIELAKNLNYQLRPEMALKSLKAIEEIKPSSLAVSSRIDARITEGWSLILLGLPDRCLGVVETIETEQLGGAAGRYHLLRGQAQLALSNLDKARLESERAEHSISENLHYYRMRLSILQAEILLAEDQHQEAVELLKAALKVGSERGYEPLTARCMLTLSLAFEQAGEHRKARVSALRALQMAGRIERPRLQAQLFHLLGRVEFELEAPNRARLYFSKSIRIFKESLLQLNGMYRAAFASEFVLPVENDRRQLLPRNSENARFLQEARRFVAGLKEQVGSKVAGDSLPEVVARRLPGFQQAVGKVDITGNGRAVGAHSDRPLPDALISALSASVANHNGTGGGASANVAGMLSMQGLRDDISEVEFDFLDLIRSILGLRDSLENGAESGAVRDASALPDLGQYGLVGQDSGMLTVMDQIRRFAPTSVTVLVYGESGTGKELVARGLHEKSGRTGAFVALNCSALPPELIESELFGHVRGSFTGADSDRKGLFEAAGNGTLLLDEIASMPLDHQTRLLRVLETGRIRPVGARESRPVDVRVVAAANEPLEELVADGRFRADLYYRLNVLPIHLPALRERPSDIPLLIHHFLDKIASKEGAKKGISREALLLLESYDYPGNVRELRNIVESAYHMSGEEMIRVRHVNGRLYSQTVRSHDEGCRWKNLADQIAQGNSCFWRDVRDPFLSRDLSRREVREIVSHGLSACGGSYRRVLEFFGLPADDYKRFLGFLSHHDCKVDFRPFRKGHL